jgi:hypothetical protein
MGLCVVKMGLCVVKTPFKLVMDTPLFTLCSNVNNGGRVMSRAENMCSKDHFWRGPCCLAHAESKYFNISSPFIENH